MDIDGSVNQDASQQRRSLRPAESAFLEQIRWINVCAHRSSLPREATECDSTVYCEGSTPPDVVGLYGEMWDSYTGKCET